MGGTHQGTSVGRFWNGHTHLGSIPGGHLQVETAVAAVFHHSLPLFKLPLDDLLSKSDNSKKKINSVNNLPLPLFPRFFLNLDW